MRIAIVFVCLSAFASSTVTAQSERRAPWWGAIGIGSGSSNGSDVGRGPSLSFGSGWVFGPRLLLGVEAGGTATTPTQMSLDGVAYFFPLRSPGPFFRIGLGPTVVMTQASDDLDFGLGASVQIGGGWDLPLSGQLRVRPFVSVAAGAGEALGRVTILGAGVVWRPPSLQ